MSGIDLTAVVAAAPGADNYGLVDVQGERRRCYFPPPYWGATATAAGWGAATVGARVAVQSDARHGMIATNRVGTGTPAYVFEGD